MREMSKDVALNINLQVGKTYTIDGGTPFHVLAANSREVRLFFGTFRYPVEQVDDDAAKVAKDAEREERTRTKPKPKADVSKLPPPA